MKSLIDRYLDRVILVANLPEAKAAGVREELRDHLLQKTEALIAAGTPREEATLEALRQHGSPRDIGYKLRGPFPWIDVRVKGTARGVIAIGPSAVGIFAFGGFACGVVAFGGCACGLFSLGGCALGLLFAFGGFAGGGLAFGGFAAGVVATGGYAIGCVVEGGQALGLWAPAALRDANEVSHYTAANVPGFLKSLQPLLKVPDVLLGHPLFFWPVYVAAIWGMIWAKARERCRIDADNDWIVGE